jgi:Fic family protein
VLPRSLVDTVYYAAPVNRIETMMNSLYRLVGSDSFSPIITACISHFYIHYVKPFPLDDPFFPAFIMKYIFIQKGYEATPVSFPIDTFLLEPSTASLFQTVQKTLDLTYWLIALLKNLELHLDAFFTYFDQQTATHIKHEKKVTVATSQALVAASLPAMQQQTLAEQLLYKHPSLKKQMAAFYASHHEPGQFYTISQFRDFANCAYETARTSMEHLVVLGYYRKEPYKNKFLYTPNPQGVAL